MKTTLVRLGGIMRKVDRRVPIMPGETYPMARIHSFVRGMSRGEERFGDEVSYSHFHQIKSGDFVYQKLMAWEGGFALVPEQLHGTFVSTESVLFELDRKIVDTNYFAHLLAWAPFWKSLAAKAVGTNVRRRRLHPEQILEHPIRLPTLGDQRLISSSLDSISETLSSLTPDEVARATADAMRNHLFRDDCSQKLPFGELFELERSAVHIDPMEQYQRVGIYSWGKGLFQREPISGSEIGSLRYFHFNEGSLMVSNIQAWEGAIAVTSAADAACVASSRFLPYVSRSSERISSRFACYFLLSDSGFPELQAASPGTQVRNRTTRPHLLRAIPVPVPAPERQHHVVHILDEAYGVTAQIQRRNRLAAALLPAARDEVFSQYH